MTVRVRLLTFGLVALLGVGASIPSAAAASEPEVPFWTLAGKRLESGSQKASIKNRSGVKTTLHSKIGTIEVEIRCESGALGEGAIEGSQAKQAGKASGILELSECKLFAKEKEAFSEQSGCEVPTIKSGKLAGAFWLEGKKGEGTTAVVVFEPKELTEGKPLIAKVAINSKETCGFKGTFALTGSFAVRLSPQNEEFTFMQWLLPEKAIATVWRPPGEEGEASIGLKLEGNTASLQGDMKVELPSEAEFGGGTAPVAGIEAPFWGVQHTRLLAGEEQELEDPPSGESAQLTWKLKGTSVETHCSGVDLQGGRLIGSLNQSDGSFVASTIKLSGCTLFVKEGEVLKEQKACQIPPIDTTELIGKLWLSGFTNERGTKPVLPLEPRILTEGKPVLATMQVQNRSGEKCAFAEEKYAIEGGLLFHLSPENEETTTLEFSATESSAHVWQSAEQFAEKQVVLSHSGELIGIKIPSILVNLKHGGIFGGGAKGVGIVGAGPFWHHRLNSKEGVGSKIEPKAQETFHGEGPEQKLKATIGGETIEITSKSVFASGSMFNNALQGQVKLELIYISPTLTKPLLKECTVTVGEKNVVQLKGHLMWKWNGAKSQLEEGAPTTQKPDLVFTPAEIGTEAKELSKGGLANVALKGLGCGVLAGTFLISGSSVWVPTPVLNVASWASALTLGTGEAKETSQHFWNGQIFQGVKAGLLFGGNTASLTGTATVKTNQQEVAIFEN
jgi:hypothetical protein